MVKGVLYATAGTRRAVIALDAATGELLWIHSENEGERGNVHPASFPAADWPTGPTAARNASSTSHRAIKMVALNAKTGMPVAAFGKNGVVDLKDDDDQVIDPMSSEIGLHSAPIIAKDVSWSGRRTSPAAFPPARRT